MRRVHRFFLTRIVIGTILIGGGIAYWRQDPMARLIAVGGGIASFVTLRPRHVLMQRAQQWYAQGKYTQALKELDEVVNWDPSYAEGWAWRGRTWLQLDDLQAAKGDLDRAIALDPEVSAYYGYRVDWARRTHAWHQAVADLDQVIQRAPTPEDYHRRAMVYLVLKQYDQALEDVNHALDLAPTGMAYWTRGRILRRKGDLVGAVAHLTQGLDLIGDPSDQWDCRRERAILDLYLGQYQDSLDDWSAVIAATDRGADYYNRAITWAFGDPCEWIAALADLDQALERDPELVNAYWLRGHVHYELGHIAAAVDDYAQGSQITGIQPTDRMAGDEHGLVARAWGRWRLGDQEGAKDDLLLALKICQSGGDPRLVSRIEAMLTEYSQSSPDDHP